jgi:hypothetical protein
MTTPCPCREHRDGAPTVLGEHEFTLDTDEAVSVGGGLVEVWRWLCACGSRGRWQPRSAGDAYHGWLGHVDRVGGAE